ncbi:MAG: Iron-sulfur flavoprotein [Methanomassiliicoccales archaeon PtaU1.Bin124]|nr:MAG: Iron-sulfur flavoprotein [Methanomassiliicoccales archaeon PtaU1.Bin124]
MTISTARSVTERRKKVVGLNGTPRVGGNSEVLLDQALSGAAESGAHVMRIDVARMKISGCDACGSCTDSGICVKDDDMTSVYSALEGADAIIVASPLYFSGLSSQLKAAIDRCQCIWVSGPARSGRPGAFICVGGDNNANFKNAVSEARSFMKGIGFEGRMEMLVAGLDVLGMAAKRADLLDKARELGRDLVLQA